MVIVSVPAVRFPVPVDVTDGVAVTVAVPGPIPRTSPAGDTVKTLVLDDSRLTALVCDGCTGFDVPSEYVSVTVSRMTSPTRTMAGPVMWAVTSRPYSQPDAVRLMNNSATTRDRPGPYMSHSCTLSASETSTGQATGHGLGWDLQTVTLAGKKTQTAGHEGEAIGGRVVSLMTFFSRHGRLRRRGNRHRSFPARADRRRDCRRSIPRPNRRP